MMRCRAEAPVMYRKAAQEPLIEENCLLKLCTKKGKHTDAAVADGHFTP